MFFRAKKRNFANDWLRLFEMRACRNNHQDGTEVSAFLLPIRISDFSCWHIASFRSAAEFGRFWRHSRDGRTCYWLDPVAIDPNVWSGRALQVDFAELAVSGLASMYPVSSWSCFAPDHHGYQRACGLISGQASIGPFGSPVFACAGKTEPPSLLILSQTSAGKGYRSGYIIADSSPHVLVFNDQTG